MKYLLTGLAGFIGARTAALLLQQGHEVVGIDNVNDYYPVALKRFRLHDLARSAGAGEPVLERLRYDAADAVAQPVEAFRAGALRFVPVDIEDVEALGALFAEEAFDGVLNLAARAGVRYSMENPHVYMTTNACGCLNLLEQMRAHGVPKLVLASTSSLYAGLQMPFTEDLPVNTPVSPYAASKKAAEAMAYTYHHLFGIDVSILRYFTVFGPAGRPDMSPLRFIRWVAEGQPIQLFGDGSQARDFTYVEDVAAATVAALKPLGYEIINIGGGKRPVTIRQFITWIEEILGKPAMIEQHPFHKADMVATWADITKAGHLLDWQPLTGVQDGLRATVTWYREHRDWLQAIPF